MKTRKRKSSKPSTKGRVKTAKRKRTRAKAVNSLDRHAALHAKRVDDHKEPRLEEIRFLRGEDSPAKETWRTFRIMAELIKGLDKLTGVSKGISMFGSARIRPGSAHYELARRTAYEIGKKG